MVESDMGTVLQRREDYRAFWIPACWKCLKQDDGKSKTLSAWRQPSRWRRLALLSEGENVGGLFRQEMNLLLSAMRMLSRRKLASG
jgi:hypothetical protein